MYDVLIHSGANIWVGFCPDEDTRELLESKLKIDGWRKAGHSHFTKISGWVEMQNGIVQFIKSDLIFRSIE